MTRSILTPSHQNNVPSTTTPKTQLFPAPPSAAKKKKEVRKLEKTGDDYSRHFSLIAENKETILSMLNATDEVVSSSEAANLLENLAETREKYHSEVKKHRLERRSWREDRRELERLQKLVRESSSSTSSSSLSTNDENCPVVTATTTAVTTAATLAGGGKIRGLLKELADQEEALEASAEDIRNLKEIISQLKNENKCLQTEVKQYKTITTHHHPNTTATIVKDLEIQLHKWQALYFESAELGSKQLGRLEEELEKAKRAAAADEPKMSKESSSNTLPRVVIDPTEMNNKVKDLDKRLEDTLIMAKSRETTLLKKLSLAETEIQLLKDQVQSYEAVKAFKETQKEARRNRRKSTDN